MALSSLGPASAGRPETSQPAPAAKSAGRTASVPGRTGHFCLMALGTFDHYRMREGGPPDMLIISPENRPQEALRKARKDHPSAMIIGYLNTMDLMLSRAEEGPRFYEEREDWFLHDSSGERVRVRMNSYHGVRTRYAMNIAHPGWVKYLADKAVSFLKIGYDGIQLDNVETDYSYRRIQVGRFMSALPVEMNEEKWYESAVVMLKSVRETATAAGFKDREIIFNHMRAGEPDRAMEYLAQVDGANAESWLDRRAPPEGKWGWRSRVDLARRAAVAGKRTNLLCTASLLSREEGLFTFASYLMAMENERNTFWYGRPYRVEDMPWFDFYETDLGRPRGEFHAVAGSGIYRRDFEKGIVLVNPQDELQGAELGDDFWNDAFETIRTAYLGPKEGAILLRPKGDPPPRMSFEAEACLESKPRKETPPPEAGRAAPVVSRIERKGLSGGAAVEFGNTTEICSLPADVAPGRYRVIVEGEGQGRDHDAALLRIGSEDRRVAFDQRREVVVMNVPRKVASIDLKGVETWVAVDRLTLIRIGDAR